MKDIPDSRVRVSHNQGIALTEVCFTEVESDGDFKEGVKNSSSLLSAKEHFIK